MSKIRVRGFIRETAGNKFNQLKEDPVKISATASKYVKSKSFNTFDTKNTNNSVNRLENLNQIIRGSLYKNNFGNDPGFITSTFYRFPSLEFGEISKLSEFSYYLDNMIYEISSELSVYPMLSENFVIETGEKVKLPTYGFTNEVKSIVDIKCISYTEESAINYTDKPAQEVGKLYGVILNKDMGDKTELELAKDSILLNDEFEEYQANFNKTVTISTKDANKATVRFTVGRTPADLNKHVFNLGLVVVQTYFALANQEESLEAQSTEIMIPHLDDKDKEVKFFSTSVCGHYIYNSIITERYKLHPIELIYSTLDTEFIKTFQDNPIYGELKGFRLFEIARTLEGYKKPNYVTLLVSELTLAAILGDSDLINTFNVTKSLTNVIKYKTIVKTVTNLSDVICSEE